MQGLGSFPDALFEHIIGAAQRKVGMPLATKGSSQLPAFNRMKRLLEEKDPVGRWNLHRKIFRFRAQRAGDDDDVDILINFANLAGRFDAIDSGWHTNVEKYDREWRAGLYCITNCLNRRQSLVAGLHIELRGALFVGLFAKQHFFKITECRGRNIGFKFRTQAFQVFTNEHHIIVHDEDTVGSSFFRCHLLESS